MSVETPAPVAEEILRNVLRIGTFPFPERKAHVHTRSASQPDAGGVGLSQTQRGELRGLNKSSVDLGEGHPLGGFPAVRRGCVR